MKLAIGTKLEVNNFMYAIIIEHNPKTYVLSVITRATGQEVGQVRYIPLFRKYGWRATASPIDYDTTVCFPAIAALCAKLNEGYYA